VQKDDTVVLHWRPGSGIQAPTPTYQWEDKPLNAGWVTTLNRHTVVSENRVTTIPSGTNLQQAALLGCAVTTGFGVVNNDAALRIGESILIIGAGGIGLSMIQGAAMASAYPIIAVDLVEEKLPLAKQMGATHATTNLQEVEQWLESDGADVVVDNTGNPRCIEKAYHLTKPQGRTILVGVPPKEDPPSFYSLPLHFGKVLKGSHGGGTEPHRDIPRYVKLMEQGRLDLTPLITDTYALSSVNDAISDLKSGKIRGRCLIAL
jgi:S-(hydroxymethyl)glutathione dehydrogenase/alcohol dehydrogenase